MPQFTWLVFALLVGLVPACRSAAAAEGIPILAWGGPPADQTSLERYRELAGAGFTHNISGFGNVASMVAALDTAQATGLKAFVSVPELKADPEGTARRFKEHPAVAGYYLQDEPRVSDFAALADWEKRVRSADPEHPCYINLFPNYADAGQLGAPSYREYLNRFASTLPVKMLSFDHYPVVGNTLRGEWYENLEQVAEVARATNKPFWAFVLSVAHGPYPVPTIEQLRCRPLATSPTVPKAFKQAVVYHDPAMLAEVESRVAQNPSVAGSLLSAAFEMPAADAQLALNRLAAHPDLLRRAANYGLALKPEALQDPWRRTFAAHTLFPVMEPDAQMRMISSVVGYAAYVGPKGGQPVSPNEIDTLLFGSVGATSLSSLQLFPGASEAVLDDSEDRLALVNLLGSHIQNAEVRTAWKKAREDLQRAVANRPPASAAKGP